MFLGNRTVPKPPDNRCCDRPVSLLVLEGDTEGVFYPIVRDKYLRGVRAELRNLKGRGNVNKDVLSEIYKYTYNNRSDLVRAYCCVDTERQKQSATPFDLDFVREQVRIRQMARVLSLDAILGDPDIESWFFYDIDGIYKSLCAKKSQRSTKKYRNPQNFSKKDLQQLFRRFDKVYLPGGRAAHFINRLDIERIVCNCKELQEGIQLIQSQAEDLTNHLFPEKKSRKR
ncbi:MAG: hypothetical protein AMJ75_05940 [Phycisphaerae bacterium SM1_79]|nr:MAG: hypothetical protein AMJ75_05940 [Phycisphaerae bacterium SM1_79]